MNSGVSVTCDVPGLGYRQKQILAVLDGRTHSVPNSYICRTCDMTPRTLSSALRSLERRGLVKHIKHGRWSAA